MAEKAKYLVGFSPNKRIVRICSCNGTDVIVLRAKARRFLAGLSNPALKDGVIEMLQMSYTQ